MENLLKLGWLAGIVGMALCLVGIGVRLSGAFWIGGFQVGTLLQAGVAGLLLHARLPHAETVIFSASR